MKRKHSSFILLEIVIGLFLFSLVATFLIEGIFRSTKKTYEDLSTLHESHLADQLSLSLLEEKIADINWKELPPFPSASWSECHHPLIEKENVEAKIKWGYLPRYDAQLTNNSHYRLVKLSIQFHPKQKPFQYCYLLRKE